MIILFSKLGVLNQGRLGGPKIDTPRGVDPSKAVVGIEKHTVDEFLFLLFKVPPDFFSLEEPHEGDHH